MQQEIGPFTSKGEERPESWVEAGSLLFIDNPVGTGFSYVTTASNFATNNSQIAADLLSFLQKFLDQKPEWQSAPLYIFSESYGGKMAITFASSILQAENEGAIKANLRCV